MKIYWSLRNVPELASLAPADRRSVHDACLRRYFLGAPAMRRSLIAYLMMILCPAALVGLTASVLHAFRVTAPVWLIALIAAAGAMLGHFVFSRIAVAHLRQFYQDYIQKELRNCAV